MAAGFRSSRLQSPTGAALAVYWTGPKGRKGSAPKAVIHINHGMADHAARYARFAEALAAAGYSVFAHDHRGHGSTTAPDAPWGRFAARDGWRMVLDDVDAVNAHIRERHPGVPLIVFGHSMGATVAAAYMLSHPGSIDAAAIWNGSMTGAGPRLLVLLLGFERMLKGSDVPSTLASRLTFEAWNRKFAPNRTEFDWLSRDVAEVDKYVADPKCGFVCTNGLWRDLLGGLQSLADRAAITALSKDLPVHVLAGAADPCSSNGAAATQLSGRLTGAGLSDVTTTVLPETRHECLNEINRDETTAAFIDWLNARFG